MPRPSEISRPLPFLLAAISILGVACAGKRAIRRPAPTAEPRPMSEIWMGPESLVEKLDFRNIKSRLDLNGMAEVVGTWIKVTTEDVAFRFRVEWFDADGFRMDDPTQAWTAIALKGAAAESVKINAGIRGVARFRMHVEWP